MTRLRPRPQWKVGIYREDPNGYLVASSRIPSLKRSCTQRGSISPRIPFSNLVALSISQPTTISPRTTAPLRRVAKLLRACRVLCNRIWSRYLQREFRAVGPGFNVDCSTRIFGPHQVEIGANFYACRGLKITTFIDVESDCDCSAKLRIGTDVALNEYVTITAVDPIELEDGVLVGSEYTLAIPITESTKGATIARQTSSPIFALLWEAVQ